MRLIAKFSRPITVAVVLLVAAGAYLLWPVIGPWLNASLSPMEKFALLIFGAGALAVFGVGFDGGGFDTDSDTGGDGGGGD